MRRIGVVFGVKHLSINIEICRTGNLRKEYIPYPIFFKNNSGVNSQIKYITSGETFTAAIDKEHNLFMFGDNYHGQCGTDPRNLLIQNVPK